MHSTTRTWMAGLFCVAFASSAAAQGSNFTIIDPPSPLTGPLGSGGAFGNAVQTLDFDGDGVLDLAVGEGGQDAVHVYLGPDFANPTILSYGPCGALGACSPGHPSESFGGALGKATFTGLTAEALLVGAPEYSSSAGAVYVITYLGGHCRITSSYSGVVNFGASVTSGDVDLDGATDLIVGAPSTDSASGPQVNAGSVQVFGTAAVGGTAQTFCGRTWYEHQLWNPGIPAGDANHGQFGTEMRVAQIGGASHLFVAAQGNSNGATPHSGGIYRLEFPVVDLPGNPAPAPVRYDDPNVVSCDSGTRFGKGFVVRDGLMAVGAPRKEPVGGTCTGPGDGQQDYGGAFLFSGTALGTVQQATDASGSQDGIFGFNVALVDLFGSSALDLVVMSPYDLELQIWNAANLAVAPTVVGMPSGSTGYFGRGVAWGDLFPTIGSEELILGDPKAGSNAGRVVIVSR